MAINKAPTISAREIAKAVDGAVKLAEDRHKVQFNTEFHIGPGIIMGRMLAKADVAIAQAEQIATEITSHVQQHGIAAKALAAPQLQPAVLIRNKLVLCGFIPGPIPEIEQLF